MKIFSKIYDLKIFLKIHIDKIIPEHIHRNPLRLNALKIPDYFQESLKNSLKNLALGVPEKNCIKSTLKDLSLKKYTLTIYV